jgi:hypothetical protein
MPHTPGHFNDSDFLVGCTVFTRDGEELGTVKEVGAGVFKMDAAMQPDYWLSTGHVASNATGRIILTFAKDQLDTYKLDNPDAATDTDRMRQTATGIRRTRSR